MLVNGIFNDNVASNDRALAYGDGLFETIRLHKGQPIYLDEHLQRLTLGCQRLQINYDSQRLIAEIQTLSQHFLKYDILKVLITREAGGRGYRPKQGAGSNRILSLHALPSDSGLERGIQTFLCQQRLAQQPTLAGIKHLNRLEQVLASLEWPSENFHEGIMLDTQDNVIEGTKSNLFLVQNGNLMTPSLNNCGVDGVMRKVLIESFKAEFNIDVNVDDIPLSQLLDAEELFICNSVFGIWPVLKLEARGQMHQYKLGPCSEKALQIFNRELN